jgi:hypothetical protein
MKFLVNESPLAPELVTFRELGFGENLSGDGAPYRIELDFDELTDTFQRKANDFIEQCRLDDLRLAEADIPKLRDLGYPPFQMLLKDELVLSSELIQDYLYFELLNCLFTARPVDAAFVINDIGSVQVQDGEIVISGSGFTKK